MPSSTVHRSASGAYLFDNGDVFISQFFGLGTAAAPETAFPWQISQDFAFVSGSSVFGFVPLSYYPNYNSTPANLTAVTDGITNFDFECITTFNNKDLLTITNFYNYLELLGSGTIDESICTQYGMVVSGTRNIGENYCLLMQSGHFGTGGTITEDVTLVIQTPAHGNGGAMTTHYGLEIENQQFGTNSWAVISHGGRWQLEYTTPILTGSENYDCIFIDITNANHTGVSNTMQAIRIDGITFDGQVTATAIKINSGGWTYGLGLPTNVGIALGDSNNAQLLFDGTGIVATGAAFYPDAVISSQGYAVPGNAFSVDETGAMLVQTLELHGAYLGVFAQTLGLNVFQISTTATGSDPIESVVQNQVTTANATPTPLHVFTIPVSTTFGIDAIVIARRTGGAGGSADDGAMYRVQAVYKGTGGTATLIGSATITPIGESQAGWDVTLSASGTDVTLSVTGAANNDVTWHMTARDWEVST